MVSAATRVGVEWTSSLQASRIYTVFARSRLHAEISSSISCRLFMVVFSCIFNLRMLHRFSMGFMSQLLLDHRSMSVPCASRNSVTERTLWYRERRRAWKWGIQCQKRLGFLAHSFSWGINRFSSIVWYCCWFICSSTMRKRPVPSTPTTLHTMTMRVDDIVLLETFSRNATDVLHSLFLALDYALVARNHLNSTHTLLARLAGNQA